MNFTRFWPTNVQWFEHHKPVKQNEHIHHQRTGKKYTSSGWGSNARKAWKWTLAKIPALPPPVSFVQKGPGNVTSVEYDKSPNIGIQIVFNGINSLFFRNISPNQTSTPDIIPEILLLLWRSGNFVLTCRWVWVYNQIGARISATASRYLLFRLLSIYIFFHFFFRWDVWEYC